MPSARFDTYYTYEDLTRILHGYAKEYPSLVQLESIGKSHEGRDIWLAAVTNGGTGPATEKPAFWIDGNIHAHELAPSSAALYLLNRLVSTYGADPDVTRCLDTRAFYICPRLNPDGAEWALATPPRLIRSSTRPYPWDEEPIGGLKVEDIDGDNRILQMRIPDPDGNWKISRDNPRLMVRREPAETGGQYYRVLPEGRVEDYDGITVRLRPMKEGLDLNRNFPANWRQEYQQKGAGEYPTSEPEARAAVGFIASHPNITGGVAFHTFSGVILRPYAWQNDESFDAEDLWTFEKIGQKGTDLTGYPAISVFHDFKYHPKEVITGGFHDWLFDHLGVFSWTVELWSPQRQAGIKAYKFIDWYREHSVDDDLEMLRWSDETLGGRGYVDWYSFEHPELGMVELGGWNQLYAFRNPPPEFLEKEIAPFSDWLIWHTLISPRLELYEASAKPLGRGDYRVRLAVKNTGWLPTYVTKKALERKVVRGVICEIELPDDATLETGRRREELGQLEGRAYKPSMPGGGMGQRHTDATDDRAKVEWVVHAPAGGTAKLVARHDRAGTIRAEVTLELEP
jgi:murein tripeptide amidase MpaA